MDIYVSRYMKQLLNLPINDCINQFQQFLINLGLQVGALKVKQTGLKAKVNRYLHQPWFDEECTLTKRKTLDLKGNSNQRATGTKMDKQELFNHFKQLHHKIIEPAACKSTAQLAKEKEVFEVIRTSKIRQSEWAGWFLHRSSKMLCKQ